MNQLYKNLLISLFLLSLIFATGISNTASAQHSVARQWNDLLLESIRNDFARPTVHARNLWHISVVMYDAWAVYEDQAAPYFLGDTLGGYIVPFNGINPPNDIKSAQEEAVSYAAYRLMKHRFANSPGAATTLPMMDDLLVNLGYDPNYTSINYASDSAAALGNYIASKMIAFGFNDFSNEQNDYTNIYYSPFNPTLLPDLPGNPDIIDPNRWQPLTLQFFIDQSGNPFPINTPEFQSPEWGKVVPFALQDSNKVVNSKDGTTYPVYHDPGMPPLLTPNDSTNTNVHYQWGFSLVSKWSSHLDPADTTMWDISPASIGNVQSYPTTIAGLQTFYDDVNGGDPGLGHSLNPATGQPYATQMVPRADYGRVLAEFWADGPDSETPPGHWFTLLNYVNDHQQFEKRWEGKGPILDDLEWDVKAYFTMGGAMHDAAVTAWGCKGWYDYVRPVSAIRFMADQGQCTDTSLSNYSEFGIPLSPGLVEVVETGDPLAGIFNINVGKIKVKAWKGPDYINDPDTDVAGVDWILAENWWPYQRPSFVTPPFAGYVSGHSTYSRAAAEIMTAMTGDPFFPGGMGEFIAVQDNFLVFEKGPSQTITLQWATYRDASDQCSLSRIWGGIHPPADDIPGRLMGIKIGVDAFNYTKSYTDPNGKPDVYEITPSTDVISNLDTGSAGFILEIVYTEEMDNNLAPVVTFPNEDPTNIISLNAGSSSWINSYTYRAAYDVSNLQVLLSDIDVAIAGAQNTTGQTQEATTEADVFSINTESLIANVFTDNISYTSMRLNWSTIEDACAYLIRGRQPGASNFVYVQVAGDTTSSFTAIDLEKGTDYEWQIAPFCPANGIDTTNNWTELQQVQTLDCIKPLFTLTMSITSTSATIAWTEVPGVLGYRVYGRQVGGAVIFIDVLGDDVTSFTATGLLPGTTYEWVVAAGCSFAPFVISDFSTINQFTTLSASPKSTIAINALDKDGQLKVYPNPLSDKATISFPNAAQDSYNLRVFDIQGRLVNQTDGITQESHQIDGSSLPVGTYFFDLTNGLNIYKGKFMISR